MSAAPLGAVLRGGRRSFLRPVSSSDGRGITLELFAPPAAYIAGETTLPIQRPESGPTKPDHATATWHDGATAAEPMESGSVRILVRDGRCAGSVTLAGGEKLTFEGPVDLDCATTQIPNTTKPGQLSFDPALESAFCSPLKALGVR